MTLTSWVAVCLLLLAGQARASGLLECLAGAGEVLQPGSRAYNSSVRLENSLFADRAPPAAVLLPSSAKEVSHAVRCARKYGRPVTARGGGHGNGGTAVLPGAVVLDLRRMDHVHVSEGGRRARLGGGARLGTVYYEIANKTGGAKGFNAGSCPTVGVGGHIPGGGMGNLIRKHGLACDSMRSLQMVDAQGRVLRASRHRHRDLFWAACGGGGGNFGVVTEYVVAPVDVPAVVTHVALTATGEEAAELAAWFLSLSPGLPDTFSPWLLWSANYTSITGINLGGEAATRALLAAAGLQQAPAGTAADLREMSWLDSVLASASWYGNLTAEQLTDYDELSGRVIQGSQVKSFYINDQGPLPEGSWRALAAFVQETPGATAYVQLMGGAANARAPRATANPWRRQAYQFTLEVAWPEGRDPPAGALDGLAEVERRMAFDLPEVLTTGYINYLDISLDRWQALARYAGPNARRLVRVKRTYDPADLFRNQWSVPLTVRPPGASEGR